MADVPDGIVLKRHRDLEGMRKTLWPRRVLVGATVAFALLGLANVFGQRPVTASADTAQASLKLNAPDHLRGGLLFSARFHITAHRDVKDAVLVLDQGWAEGMAINTIEPSPIGEASRNGKLSLDLGHIPAGRSYVLYMQFQANATNVAWRRPAGVTLLDGSTRLLDIDRKVTVYP
ncbi:MAG TPA: hypothetical protein VFU51_04745, partial [Gaiellaceae bacterium]|jgi:hypothetical protein|nr:hypothetical protein [Gaiellaceae bacterium]